uniref:Uncharacterized protein n=1 Tax=Arundo donax TaxID=35708 RepID=A0A0A9EH58_ARUDO
MLLLKLLSKKSRTTSPSNHRYVEQVNYR